MKQKNWARCFGLLIAIVCLLMMYPAAVKAEQTADTDSSAAQTGNTDSSAPQTGNADNSAPQTGNTDSSAANGSADAGLEQEIKYTIRRVSEKILMLPGETRMASTIIPSTATFSSSNTKLALVSNRGQIVAKKPGMVKITMTDGTVKTIYTVQIASEVDVIIFAGQSNMCGSGGNKQQAPTPKYGTAYEFDLDAGSQKCILMKEPFGEGLNRANGLEGDSASYSRRGTLTSAFCINYYKQTKTPVVGIAASWGGSSTNTWLSRGLVKQTQRKLKIAKKQLKKQGIKIRHIYMVWLQGESDAKQERTQEAYISAMRKIHARMKKYGVEKTFMILIGQDAGHPERNGTIIAAQKKLCKKYNDFILVSKKAPTFYNNYWQNYTDTVHLNQKCLNAIGYEAGKNAGKYAKKHTKK